jgi:hypothetical protein
VIDTGIAANNPDIDYSRIILGQDRVDGDANPLLSAGEGSDRERTRFIHKCVRPFSQILRSNPINLDKLSQNPATPQHS